MSSPTRSLTAWNAILGVTVLAFSGVLHYVLPDEATLGACGTGGENLWFWAVVASDAALAVSLTAIVAACARGVCDEDASAMPFVLVLFAGVLGQLLQIGWAAYGLIVLFPTLELDPSCDPGWVRVCVGISIANIAVLAPLLVASARRIILGCDDRTHVRPDDFRIARPSRRDE